METKYLNMEQEWKSDYSGEDESIKLGIGWEWE